MNYSFMNGKHGQKFDSKSILGESLLHIKIRWKKKNLQRIKNNFLYNFYFLVVKHGLLHNFKTVFFILFLLCYFEL